jgi:RHS repeat-associated protein
MTKNMQSRLILLGLALCAAAAPAQAQIAFRAVRAQVVGTGTSITPLIPDEMLAGDVAILIIAGRPTNTTEPAAPAGWTLRSSSLREVGANDLKIMTFYRVITGSEDNPTVNLPSAWQGTAAGMSGQIAVWSGVNTTTPFDVADVTGNATTATTWTPPAITTVTPGAWVVSAVATSDDNALAIGTAQGFTGRMTGAGYDTTTGGDHAVGLADKVQATAGTPVMLTWNQTINASDRWAGITFALRPAPPNIPPTVSLTSPAGGATFTAPAAITLTATAADTDGTIAKVEFFHGGTNLIATFTEEFPYTFNWTNVAAASYTLTAKATDNLNATTTSAPINVTVNTGVAQLYFVHTDHLDTPRVITNQAQQVVWRWDHAEPFGADPANGNPSGLGAFEFNPRLPGQYFDKETNLHYNYFRDYDPAIGRYIQSDPVGLNGGVNTYAYVYDNPLRFTDPFGLAGSNPCPRGGGSGGGAGGAACTQSWDDCVDNCTQSRIGDPRRVALNLIAGGGLFAIVSTPVTFPGIGTTSLGTLMGALAGRGYGSLVGGAQAVRAGAYAGAVLGRSAVWLGGVALAGYGGYAFGSVLYCSAVCANDSCYY